MVDDVMERRILVYIEENDEQMEQLITQNVYRIVKIVRHWEGGWISVKKF